ELSHLNWIDQILFVIFYWRIFAIALLTIFCINFFVSQKMKLLDNSKLDAVSSTLSFETPACDITTRVESYSCKMAGDPKKLYKQLRNEPGTSPHDLEILGPS
ncbi:unnamed protein product, partial [Rotaria magnacalcarata]